jgi:hypothetical protein
VVCGANHRAGQLGGNGPPKCIKINSYKFIRIRFYSHECIHIHMSGDERAFLFYFIYSI